MIPTAQSLFAKNTDNSYKTYTLSADFCQQVYDTRCIRRVDQAFHTGKPLKIHITLTSAHWTTWYLTGEAEKRVEAAKKWFQNRNGAVELYCDEASAIGQLHTVQEANIFEVGNSQNSPFSQAASRGWLSWLTNDSSSDSRIAGPFTGTLEIKLPSTEEFEKNSKVLGAICSVTGIRSCMRPVCRLRYVSLHCPASGAVNISDDQLVAISEPFVVVSCPEKLE
jgi:hypothetical protein